MVTLTTLFYVYAGYIMPPFAYKKLQATFTALLETLASKSDSETLPGNESGLPIWVFLPQKGRGSLIRVLRGWKIMLNMYGPER